MSDRFDLRAIHDALDAQRVARGLTWSALGKELGIAPATLRALGSRPVAEGDGVLRVVTWLGRSIESFADSSTNTDRRDLPADGPPRWLRFDVRAIYRSLDDVRLARGMTWRDVANATGFTQPSALTRLESGGRIMFPAAMRLFTWLDMPAAHFTRADTPWMNTTS